jgi:NADPH:quinone reductase-like Zn-dependent oxidoreductase
MIDRATNRNRVSGDQMKAFALERADSPASVVELPTPEAPANGALVRVRAASVNGFDVYQASGGLAGMMEHEFPTVLGRDFAGVVEGVGSGFDAFSPGDEVLGFVPSTPPLRVGTFAELVAGGPEIVLARKPQALDFDRAAALPLAGSAAIDLLDAVAVGRGDELLVVGATGGVGSFVVQLAAKRGVRVIATAKPDEEAWVRGLGAAETVDYSSGSAADAVRQLRPDGVAALVDMVSRGDAFTEVAAVVRRGGKVASLVGAADPDALATHGVTGTNVLARPTPEKLARLADAAASGDLHVEIQGTYDLDQVNEALQAFQRGTRGKLIIRP